MNAYPTEQQVVDGGVIDWTRLELRARKDRPGTMYYVPVRCGVCHKERTVQAPSVLSSISLGKSTARCRTCAPLRKRERLLAAHKAKGIECLGNGASIDWVTVESPPSGVSGKAYTVDLVCRCGYRRRRTIGQLTPTSGMCPQCAHSDIHAGPKNGRWKGGAITSDGYRMVRIPPNHTMIDMCERFSKSGWGRALEHRLVAAMEIGRPLEPWEHVHHLNQDKLDNRPENLQIVTPDKHFTITMMETEIKRLRIENKQMMTALLMLLNTLSIDSPALEASATL